MDCACQGIAEKEVICTSAALPPGKQINDPFPLSLGLVGELTLSSTNYFVLPMEKLHCSYKG